MKVERILNSFPELDETKRHQFMQLESLYELWNTRINVISRKDITALYTRHVLHSLSIAKVQPFKAGSDILDVGTGGGFPGIPLAILYPEVHFYLVDSIGKKIKVVRAVTEALGLANVKATHSRAETIEKRFDFIVSRAVARMPDFVPWVSNKIKKESKHKLRNGILYLKGGELAEELKDFPKAIVYPLNRYFTESFFETKKVVYLPLAYSS
ncbi:MAG: 16S rRNA (guanine(527)-N(7))-methyltransferase RsmG [Bacteroidota bacterium]